MNDEYRYQLQEPQQNVGKADLSCAVANAAGPVRRAADRVIASNRENGVARFIAGDFKP